MNLKPIVAAAALIISSAAPLAARQSPAADSSATLPALPRDSATSFGPRVRADIPRVASLSAGAEPVRRDVHTLRITTLVLVLAVVILVLLIT